MQLINITVGESEVSCDVEAILGADSVGSCIAITLYDPVARLGGLLHLQFPESRSDPPRAQHQPCLYADTGISHILRQACRQGAEKGRLLVTITGGAEVADEAGALKMGRQNYLAVRKVLWKRGVLLHGESVGGTVVRNIRLEVKTGKSWLPELD